jgi:Ca2+:H+ antiporter
MKKKFINFSNVLPIISILVLFYSFATSSNNLLVSLLASLFLMSSIITAVHHSEVVADVIGESLGTLVLALSVTIIEVGLIISLMHANDPGSDVIARDTVFAAVMIVCNGIVGICLILGGLKYKEQGFQIHGAGSLLMMLIVLSALTLVLPTFTTATPGPTYSASQLIFAASVSVVLYLIFIFFQTKSHKYYFTSQNVKQEKDSDDHITNKFVSFEFWLSFFAMIISLISVIGLAKFLAPMIENTVVYIGAPKSVVGLFIAIIILLPETWAAVIAARSNRLQTSLNLALGSGVASIALTIPAVSLFSLMTDRPLILGLDGKGLVFLMTTFLVGNISLGSGKTNALQGAVHLAILLAYFVVVFIP